jgi:hypothetical protein
MNVIAVDLTCDFPPNHRFALEIGGFESNMEITQLAHVDSNLVRYLCHFTRWSVRGLGCCDEEEMMERW